MSTVWAIIVSVIILMVIYGYVAAKFKARKKRIAREKSLPLVADTVRLGTKYNVHLSDGRKFIQVEFVGSALAEDNTLPFSGWEDMLILKHDNGKKIFLKQSAVRVIEEA